MNVLVACECSGRVRSAFRRLGHNAFSADLLPAEDGGEHILCDHDLHLLDIIEGWNGILWDLLLAFPPCTHLASSGARYFAQKRADGRQAQGAAFFMAMINAPVPRIAVENPVGVMSSLYRKPDQIIQPYHFGHPESKATCLWLKNLPKLTPTKICEPVWYQNKDASDYKDAKGKRYSPSHFLLGRMHLARWANQTPSGQNKLPPSPNRASLRSKTYPGIATAMAAQWGILPPPSIPTSPIKARHIQS